MGKRTPFWGNGSGFGAEASHQFRLTFLTLVLQTSFRAGLLFFLKPFSTPILCSMFFPELFKKTKKLPGKP
ncbi:MAG: hypothetical protein IJQ31_12985 [Thermoguttaceae bacterium]|nr:hypothetical protein [Thermoguttaceae bacterium]